MSNQFTYILDLDNTIFQTKSMKAAWFEPFFTHLRKNLTTIYSEVVAQEIIKDLWTFSWDVVVQKYCIPKTVFMDSVAVLNSMEFKLDIKTFDDYHYLKKIPFQKFLVTTSVPSIQKAKIKALGIENDFSKIVINDPLMDGGSKRDIFNSLVMEYGLLPDKTIVIGDNPESEIAAGNELGMITVQVLREGVAFGNNAKHHITSFAELDGLIGRLSK